MKMMDKKMIAGVLAGAMLLSGGLSFVHAEQNGEHRMNRVEHAKFGHSQPPQVDKEKAAQFIAEAFQLDREEILEALESQADFRDVGHAAMLAKASGKSFKDVLGMKNQGNHWREIHESLGVTREQLRDVMNSMAARRIAEGGNVEQSVAENLLKNGYHARDIEAAGALGKAAGKDIQAVLDMKKINNRWGDVAKSLGVDEKVLYEGRRGPKAP